MTKGNMKVKIFATLLGMSMLVTSLPVSATELAEPEDNTMSEESGIIDTTPPELKSLKIVKNEKGYLEFVATGTDDISGLASVSIRFEHLIYGHSYSISNENGITTIYGQLVPGGSIVAPGTYNIDYIYISDNAGNTVSYSGDNIPEEVEKSINWVDQNGFGSSGSSSSWTNSHFKTLTLDKTEVETSDTITVKATYQEDAIVGEEDHVYFNIYNENGLISGYGSSLSVVLRDEDGDGEYIGVLEIPAYQTEGTYKISQGNTDEYYGSEEVKNLSFTLTNSKMDIKAPEAKSIELKSNMISVPGSIEVVADFSDDFSGVERASVQFVSETGKCITVLFLSDYGTVIDEEGLYHSYISTSQYSETAKYIIQEVDVQDKVGNVIRYHKDITEETIESYDGIHKVVSAPLKDNFKALSFKITNDSDETDKLTTTVGTSLVDDIKAVDDNATISIDITGNTVLPKEALNAIKGTNKTLLLNTSSLQWVIKGTDITGTTSDIDFGGEIITYYSQYTFQKEPYKYLTPFLEDVDTFLVAGLFHKSELPCKVKCRLIDGIFSKRLSSGIKIYYFDENTKSLQLVSEKASITNGNNLEFEVTHGGTYIVTSEELDTTQKNDTPDTPDEPNTPNKPSSPSTPDTPSKPTTPTTPAVPDKPQNPDEEIPTGPSTWESKEGTEGFVYRLYNVALTRDAEQAGLNDWNNKLQSKTQTAAEVAQGIFFSPEFQNKEYSDVQYVKLLYRTMFGREADETGLKGWLDKLNSGMSREYVFRGFAESQEFENLCNSYNINRGTVTLGQYRDKNEGATGYVARLYTKMLGRKFEENGIEYWCKEYLTGKVTIENIATNGFLHSQEFTNLNLSDEEFVTRMYQTFLNREPDEAGYKDWVGKLKSGQKTRDDLVYGFSLSQEFANLKKSYGL